MNPAKRFQTLCYVIEGLNSFATVIYFNYLFFFFRDTFGFKDRQNLELAAFIGMIYVVASLAAGKIARRIGYFNALKLGFAVMLVGLAVGSHLHSVAGNIAAACVANFGMCFIWPVLEALVSEGADTSRAVGIYNIVWSVTNASAFFIGGTLIVKFGYHSIFYVPLGLIALELAATFLLEKIHPKELASVKSVEHPAASREKRPSPALVKNFQRMAWLSNPFAYIAINTLIAVMPGIAHKFYMSPMFAGFACSLWCFVRVGAFAILWKWSRWHYDFGWLAWAFGLMVVSFAAILVSPSLALVLLAQIFFGAAIGLIYYSSLFYAMDAHDSSSEHGGIHEAAIGLGNCLGPAAGAAALQFFPQTPNSGALAVSVLLLCGLGGLMAMAKNGMAKK